MKQVIKDLKNVKKVSRPKASKFTLKEKLIMAICTTVIASSVTMIASYAAAPARKTNNNLLLVKEPKVILSANSSANTSGCSDPLATASEMGDRWNGKLGEDWNFYPKRESCKAECAKAGQDFSEYKAVFSEGQDDEEWRGWYQGTCCCKPKSTPKPKTYTCAEASNLKTDAELIEFYKYLRDNTPFNTGKTLDVFGNYACRIKGISSSNRLDYFDYIRVDAGLNTDMIAMNVLLQAGNAAFSDVALNGLTVLLSRCCEIDYDYLSEGECNIVTIATTKRNLLINHYADYKFFTKRPILSNGVSVDPKLQIIEPSLGKCKIDCQCEEGQEKKCTLSDYNGKEIKSFPLSAKSKPFKGGDSYYGCMGVESSSVIKELIKAFDAGKCCSKNNL